MCRSSLHILRIQLCARERALPFPFASQQSERQKKEKNTRQIKIAYLQVAKQYRKWLLNNELRGAIVERTNNIVQRQWRQR